MSMRVMFGDDEVSVTENEHRDVAEQKCRWGVENCCSWSEEESKKVRAPCHRQLAGIGR